MYTSDWGKNEGESAIKCFDSSKQFFVSLFAYFHIGWSMVSIRITQRPKISLDSDRQIRVTVQIMRLEKIIIRLLLLL